MKGNGVPLVVTCNTNFKDLSLLIRKNLQFLYADPETKSVFMPAPFVSFESVKNLKGFLVRSLVYPLERKVGSAKRNGKRFQVCLSISESCNFESFQTKQKSKTNHHLNGNNNFNLFIVL